MEMRMEDGRKIEKVGYGNVGKNRIETRLKYARADRKQ